MQPFAASARNKDQIEFWNGAGGTLWTERRVIQDVMLEPVSTLLRVAAAARPGDHVIDIGCGCGTTALEMAEAVGPAGRVLGIDVSAEMLAEARRRVRPGQPVEVVQADATVHPFEPATVDLLVSRFGVMFFAEPVVSLANLRRALKPGGRLAFACWQEPKKNPWMIAPLMAAYRHVPKLPPVGPEDPGPFAFADEARVRRILGDAGFGAVSLTPHALMFDLAAGRDLDTAVDAALQFGPTARAVEGQPPETVAKVRAAIHETLAAHWKDGKLLLAGAIWIVTAASA